MKKKKILIGMLLAFTSAVALASCGSKKSNKKSNESSSSEVSSSSGENGGQSSSENVGQSSSDDGGQSSSSSESQATEATVTFNVNDGDAVEPVEIAFGEKLALTTPTDSENGRKFLGWFTDEACTTEFNDFDVVEKSMTLYAKWEEYELTDIYQDYIHLNYVKDFLNFRANSSNTASKVVLDKDIDLGNITAEEIETSKIQGFAGTFDGNGNKIKNAVYDETKQNKTGLVFRSITGGTVKNVKFVACTVSGGKQQGVGFIAGLVGGKCTFEDIEFNACSLINVGTYGGFLGGEFNETGSYNATATIRRITTKNDCRIQTGQYGGMLFGDITDKGVETLNATDLDLEGTLITEGATSASFVFGRMRQGNFSIKNAILKPTFGSADANKVNVFCGGDSASTAITVENVVVISNEKLQPAAYKGNITKTNVYYTGTEEGYTTVAESDVNIDWLKETLKLDFSENGAWEVEENDATRYKLKTSSSNVRTPGSTLARLLPSLGATQVRFKKGAEFNSNNLVVFAVFDDDVQLVLSADQYTIDSTAYDKDTVNTYAIKITSKEDESVFITYDVSLVEQTGFVVNDEFMVKTYVTGQELDASSLVVYSQWSDNVLEKLVYNKDTKEYTIDSEAFDKNTAGKYDIKIKNSTFEDIIVPVTVIDTKPIVVEDHVYVNVDGTIDSIDGTKVDGVETFKTVTAAIDYLEACGYDDDVIKVVYIADGKYEEKINTALPNLHLVGESVENTIITYSAVEGTISPLTQQPYGLQNDDCATVHVNGYGFAATNIQIRNDFDYIENTITKAISSAQGLALTINADGAVLTNVHLYGNQDTLYLKDGRTYFTNSKIEGNVDFIFGQPTGIALFENCVINAVYRGDVKNNGYVTAAKMEESSKPDYGYVFLNCQFTHDDGVKDGSMALGRPWGASATVAYINCNFSSAYSKDAAGSEPCRWTSMSGNTPQNADFAEYGSTGDGAITEAVAGGRILTKEEADNYTLAKILAKKGNGKATFTKDFDFAAMLTALSAEATKTAATAIIDANATSQNVTVARGGKTDVTAYVIPWNADNKEISIQIEDETLVDYDGFYLYGKAEGNTTVVLTHDNLTYTLNVTIEAKKEYTVTFETEGSEVAAQTVLDGEKIDSTAITTTKENSVFKGWFLDDEYNEEFDVNNDVIEGNTTLYARFVNWADIYKENATIYFNGTSSNGINTFTYLNESSAAGTYYGITTSGKLAYRPANTDTQFNSGVEFSFAVEAYATIVLTQKAAFNVEVYLGTDKVTPTVNGTVVTYTTDKAGTIKIKNAESSNKYLTSLEVSYPEYIKKSSVINFGSDGNYNTFDELYDSSANYGQIQAKCNQIKGTIEFYVNPGATISVSSYSGYTNYKLTVDGVESEAQTGTSYSIKSVNGGKVVMTATTSNNYIYSISVTYPAKIEDDLTISFATNGNIYDQIDGVAVACTVLDNNGDGSAQVKNGTITLSLKGEALITIEGNWAIDFVIGDTAVKSTNAGGEYDGTTYTYNASAGDVVITVDGSGKNYFKSITISYK